jgi:hypothetical protein
MNKFTLQIIMGLVGIIPVATGLLGMMGVNDPVYVAAGVPPILLLDTSLRFFSGVWVGLGVALWWLTPHNREANGPLSRALGHDLPRRHWSSSVDDHTGMAARRLYCDRNRRCAAVHLVAVSGGEVRK